MIGDIDLVIEETASRERSSEIDQNSTDKLIVPSKSKDGDQVTNSVSSEKNPDAIECKRKEECAGCGRTSEGVSDLDTPEADGEIFTELSVEGNTQRISAARIPELDQAITHLQYAVYFLLDENHEIKQKYKAVLSALTEGYEEEIRAEAEKNDALRKEIDTLLTKFETEKDKTPTSFCTNCVSAHTPLSNTRESAVSKQVSDHLDERRQVDHDTIPENFNTQEPDTVSETTIAINDMHNAVSNTTEEEHPLKHNITPIAGEIDLVISHVKSDVTGTHLREYLANIGVQVNQCDLLTTRNNAAFLAYKVRITSNDVEKVKNPLVWPEGTKITPYDRARRGFSHGSYPRQLPSYPRQLPTRPRSTTYSSRILQNSTIRRINKVGANSYQPMQAWH